MSVELLLNYQLMPELVLVLMGLNPFVLENRLVLFLDIAEDVFNICL